MKKIQIGVMGSAADLNYSKDTLAFAKELGKLFDFPVFYEPEIDKKFLEDFYNNKKLS